MATSQELMRLVNERRASIQNNLLRGVVSDWTQYREQVGRLQAFDQVLLWLTEGEHESPANGRDKDRPSHGDHETSGEPAS